MTVLHCLRQRDFLVRLAAASLVLSLGVAATTIVLRVQWSLADPDLPYPGADAIDVITARVPHSSRSTMSWPDSETLLERADALESIAGYQLVYANVPDSGDSFAINTCYYRGDLLDVAAVPLALGRKPTVNENRKGELVAVISEGLWKRLFGARQDIVGQRLNLDGRNFEIIGVASERFYWPNRQIDVWYPAARYQEVRDSRLWNVVARRKAGVGHADAKAQVERVAGELAREFPTNYRVSFETSTLADFTVARWTRARRALAFTLAALLVGLLGTSLALGYFQTAMNLDRLAIMAALGAGPRRIVAGLAFESALTTAVSGALGAALTWVVLRSLGSRPVVGLEGPTVFAAAVTTIPAILVFVSHLAAAVWSSGTSIRLIGDGRRGLGRFATTATFRRVSLLQLASATAIVLNAVGAARVMSAAVNQPVGFESDRLMVVSLSARGAGRQTGADLMQFFDGLADRLDHLPGVERVASSTSVPFTELGVPMEARYKATAAPLDNEFAAPRSVVRVIDNGYFSTMGIRTISGPGFGDRMSANRSIVINRTLKQRAFGNDNAEGQPIEFKIGGRAWESFSVVGVVEDTRWRLDGDPTEEAYVLRAVFPVYWPHNVLLRVSREPHKLAEPIRRALVEYDHRTPAHRIITMRTLIDDAAQEAVAAARLTLYATGASIAMLGLTGWIAGRLRLLQERRQLQVRSALGATPARLQSEWLTASVRHSLAGVLAGVAIVGLLAPLLLPSFAVSLSGADYVTTAVTLMIVNIIASSSGIRHVSAAGRSAA